MEPYFTEEDFLKYSLHPSLLDLIKETEHAFIQQTANQHRVGEQDASISKQDISSVDSFRPKKRRSREPDSHTKETPSVQKQVTVASVQRSVVSMETPFSDKPKNQSMETEAVVTEMPLKNTAVSEAIGSPVTDDGGSGREDMTNKEAKMGQDIHCPSKPKIHIPKIPYPRLSRLTKDEQKLYLELYKKYVQSQAVPCSRGEMKAFHQFKELQAQVFAEQEEFMKYLQNVAHAQQVNYHSMHPEAEYYIKQVVSNRLERVQKYPRFYVNQDTVAIAAPKVPPSLPFFHVKTLLNLGSVPVMNSTGKIKEYLKLDYDKVQSVVPAEYPDVKGKCVCSEDPLCARLAGEHGADIVISSSALSCLVNNHAPFNRQWEFPFEVRETSEKAAKGQVIHRKTVFIDKPFVPKQMTVRERMTWYCKFALRARLQCWKFVAKFQQCKKEPLSFVNPKKELRKRQNVERTGGNHGVDAYESGESESNSDDDIRDVTPLEATKKLVTDQSVEEEDRSLTGLALVKEKKHPPQPKQHRSSFNTSESVFDVVNLEDLETFGAGYDKPKDKSVVLTKPQRNTRTNLKQKDKRLAGVGSSQASESADRSTGKPSESDGIVDVNREESGGTEMVQGRSGGKGDRSAGLDSTLSDSEEENLMIDCENGADDELANYFTQNGESGSAADAGGVAPENRSEEAGEKVIPQVDGPADEKSVKTQARRRSTRNRPSLFGEAGTQDRDVSSDVDAKPQRRSSRLSHESDAVGGCAPSLVADDSTSKSKRQRRGGIIFRQTSLGVDSTLKSHVPKPELDANVSNSRESSHKSSAKKRGLGGGIRNIPLRRSSSRLSAVKLEPTSADTSMSEDEKKEESSQTVEQSEECSVPPQESEVQETRGCLGDGGDCGSSSMTASGTSPVVELITGPPAIIASEHVNSSTSAEDVGDSSVLRESDTPAVDDASALVDNNTQDVGDESSLVDSDPQLLVNVSVLVGNDPQAAGDVSAQEDNVTQAVSNASAVVDTDTQSVGDTSARLDNDTQSIGDGSGWVDTDTQSVGNDSAGVDNDTHAVDDGSARIDSDTQAVDDGSLRIDNGKHAVDDGSARIDSDTQAVDDGSVRVDNDTHAVGDGSALADSDMEELTSPRRRKSRRLTVSDEESDGGTEPKRRKPAKAPKPPPKSKQATNWSIVKRDVPKKPAIKTKAMNMKMGLADPGLQIHKPPVRRQPRVSHVSLPKKSAAVVRRASGKAPYGIVVPDLVAELRGSLGPKEPAEVGVTLGPAASAPVPEPKRMMTQAEVVCKSRDLAPVAMPIQRTWTRTVAEDTHEGTDPVAKAKRRSHVTKSVTSAHVHLPASDFTAPASPVRCNAGSRETPVSPVRGDSALLQCPKIIPLEKGSLEATDTASRKSLSAASQAVAPRMLRERTGRQKNSGNRSGTDLQSHAKPCTHQPEIKRTHRTTASRKNSIESFDVLGDILGQPAPGVSETALASGPTEDVPITGHASHPNAKGRVTSERTVTSEPGVTSEPCALRTMDPVKQDPVCAEGNASKEVNARPEEKCKGGSQMRAASFATPHLYSAPPHIRDPNEWLMYEKPAESQQPAAGNVTYNLWQVAKQRVLIRCGYHGFVKEKKTGNMSFVHIQPKLEYQLFYGYEQLTAEEISKAWVNLAIRHNCRVKRAHVNARAGVSHEVVKYGDHDLMAVLQSAQNVFNPLASIHVLAGVFSKLHNLPAGHYLLSHAPGNAHAHIKKTTRSRSGVYDLKLAYEGVQVDGDSVPWVPVDPHVLLPVHEYLGRVPCTFEPKNSGYVIAPKKKKKKNKSKKQN